jgi:hypothetical protein
MAFELAWVGRTVDEIYFLFCFFFVGQAVAFQVIKFDWSSLGPPAGLLFLADGNTAIVVVVTHAYCRGNRLRSFRSDGRRRSFLASTTVCDKVELCSCNRTFSLYEARESWLRVLESLL